MSDNKPENLDVSEQETQSDNDTKREAGGFGEVFTVLIQALILALVVRTFLFQPFNIPSGSMMPTLLIGDYLFVSKYSYGYSKFSFPMSPDIFEGRIWSGEPKRGDIVVFKYPHDTSIDYIKRVIGLPGDKVQVIDGVVHINDEPVKREKKGVFISEDANNTEVPVYEETLPNGVTYDTLDTNPDGAGDNTPVFEVPQGHYFMMGDNRDNSADSRFDVGYVPAENLIGRANVVFFSVANDSNPLAFWHWPQDMRTDRFFTGL